MIIMIPSKSGNCKAFNLKAAPGRASRGFNYEAHNPTADKFNITLTSAEPCTKFNRNRTIIRD